MDPIYLDYNSTTPVDPRVIESLTEHLKTERGNPSSAHFYGKKMHRLLELHRAKIAAFFSVDPQEVVFNSGGTEGAAFFIHSLLKEPEGKHVITSNVEHSAIYHNLKEKERQGATVSFLPVGEWGSLRAEQVKESIRPETRCIFLIAANNETGVLTDIESIAELASSYGIPLIVDGVCWLGKALFSLPPGVSGVFFSGHKIYAPKGIGFCICRRNLKMSPLFFGGEQERKRRAGTENLPGIVALSRAIALLQEEQKENIFHMQSLMQFFEKNLLENLPGVFINGQGPRLSNTMNLAFEGVNGESLLLQLDQSGVAVSHGSACSSGSLEPSRVLLAMGFPLDRVRSSLRFSIGKTTTKEEIERAIEIIVKVVSRLRA